MIGPKGENLNTVIEDFFATGGKVEELPAGASRCVDNEGLNWQQVNERAWQKRQMPEGAAR